MFGTAFFNGLILPMKLPEVVKIKKRSLFRIHCYLSDGLGKFFVFDNDGHIGVMCWGNIQESYLREALLRKNPKTLDTFEY